MGVHQFDSLPRYVRFLQENPQEVELLYKELLIGVTNFFRDPGMFDFLKEKADSAVAPGPAHDTPCGSGIPVAPPARRPTRWPSCSRSAWRG